MIQQTITDMQTVPTVIAHFGAAPAYLEVARRFTADCKNYVVLLGNAANRGFWKDQWDRSRAELPKWDEFNRS